MNRIIVIGSPGSGKSTLSKKLAKKLDLPLIHLDKLFWTSGWVGVSREEFDKKLLEEMKKDKWIMDGDYLRTLPMRLEKSDMVIYFDYSTALCLFRVIKRVIKLHGKTRSDMGNNCPERVDFEFLKYVWNYRKTKRQKTLELLKGKENVIIIRTKSDYKRFEREYL